MDNDTATIMSCLGEYRILEQSGILAIDQARSPFFRPSITYALVRLADAMGVASKQGMRINDTEDVYPAPRENDLTSLIFACRAAACHFDSDYHRVDRSKFVFGTVRGVGLGNMIQGRQLRCEYDDDLAIFFGEMRLYLVRNLLRAIERVRERYPMDFR